MNHSIFAFFCYSSNHTSPWQLLYFHFLLQCSAQPCDSGKLSNKDVVDRFQREYGQVDDEYKCYYDPKTPGEAFANRLGEKSNKIMIVNCILWPMLVISIGIGLLGTLFLRSKGLCCKTLPRPPAKSLNVWPIKGPKTPKKKQRNLLTCAV